MAPLAGFLPVHLILPADAYLGESPSDGTGLLGSEVQWQVLFALVQLLEVRALLLVHDSEDASDRLAGGAAVCTREGDCDVSVTLTTPCASVTTNSPAFQMHICPRFSKTRLDRLCSMYSHLLSTAPSHRADSSLNAISSNEGSDTIAGLMTILVWTLTFG